jgi:hypothetical protein
MRYKENVRDLTVGKGNNKTVKKSVCSILHIEAHLRKTILRFFDTSMDTSTLQGAGQAKGLEMSGEIQPGKMIRFYISSKALSSESFKAVVKRLGA